MALELAELMTRVVAIQKEAFAALATPKTIDAKPYFWHTQEAFPYMTNRLGAFVVGEDSEDVDTVRFDVAMRLVIGHLTSAYKGEHEAQLAGWLAQLIEYFNEREWLQSAVYPTEMRFLMSARVLSGAGYQVFLNSGVGTPQVGAEITLRCEFTHDILQAYA